VAKNGDTIRAKRSDRNADLAAKRADVAVDEQEPVAVESVDVAPGASATWLRWQKGNPVSNPFGSPVFLADAWSLASDLDVPLLPSLPRPERVRELREGCRLAVERVAERACVTPEMWSAYEYGDEWVLQHVNEGQLLKFVSTMSICVAAGGPPDPGEPDPVPARPPMRVVGAELLDDLAREAGDRFPLSHVVQDDRLSVAIARGEVPSPTLTDWPSEKEAAALVAAFPGLANRLQSVAWTHGSLLVDLIERTDLTDQPFQPRDELGVGKADMLRVLGAMAAIVQADPERVAAIEAKRAERHEQHEEREAAAARARAAVAQAALILAQAESDAATAALAEVVS
jgi:hypothetical protein